MNYRHGFHAGNFADVVKHVALVAALLHLKKKPAPFAVIDSHAGAGLYDLASDAARRTGEAANGIEKLRGPEPPDTNALPQALALYLSLVGASETYPGSPLIAARLLRPQDRLLAIEKHPEEAALLKKALAPFRKARAEPGDGYGRLIANLPPPERRGLVLIDPPFEAPDEFHAVADTLAAALRRFATGIYIVWYPIKSPAAARAFAGEVLASGTAPVLAIDIAARAPEGRLARAGLLVLNPPFGFEPAMRDSLSWIASRLEGGAATLEWLRTKA